MGQISFKISDAEKEFLEWVAKRTAQPVSTIYRNATLESFQDWKLNYLLKEYQNGNIGLKQFTKLAHINFNQAILYLQKFNIEPPISEIIDDYTTNLAETIKPETAFKNKKVPRSKSKEVANIN